MAKLTPLARSMDRLRAAERALGETLLREYPVGGAVCWLSNGPTVRYGRVLMHGHGDRLCVRNELTGKSYWIGAYNVRQAEAFR
jgi:hypothetical protein